MSFALFIAVNAPSRLAVICPSEMAAGEPSDGTDRGVSSTTLTYFPPDPATSSLARSNAATRSPIPAST